jgi:hypothetical protein
LVAALLVTALGTACGGGGTNKDVHPRATEPRPAAASRPESITTAPVVTATTAPPRVVAAGFGFDRVVPPRVVDRGRDLFVIARSLLLYGRWLDQHRPDPALTPHAYLVGSTMARAVAADLARSRRARVRVIEVDDRPLAFRKLSELPNVFSLELTEHLAHRERVTLRGRVLERVGPGSESYVVVVKRFGPGFPWRLLDVEPKGRPIEVQL